MSSSPFDPITSGLTDLAGAVGVLTAPRLHPMTGDTAERADDLSQNLAHTAVQTEDWLAGMVETSQSQATLDHKLSSCMTPAALAEWKTRIARMGDREQQMAEISPYLAEEKKRREALAEHAAGTFTSLPECPVSDAVPNSVAGEQTGPGGTEKDSADGDRLGDEGESGTEETPVTMSTDTPQTPVTMSTDTGSPRATVSDASANTELSSSTMAADPATRAALSGQMTPTQGQGAGTGTPQASPAAMSGGVPVSQQLSQPARGGSGGGAGRTRRSPEARREDQDKQAENDATVQAAAGVTMAGAGGAMGAAMTSAPSSPGTTTSGAPTAPVTPATPPSTAQGAPPAGAGGAGMGGMGRGAPLGSGNGVSNTKPVVSAEQPLTPEELDRLLKSEDDKKDGTK